jgi:hypothetical protein
MRGRFQSTDLGVQNLGYDPKEDGEQGKSMLEKVEREREAAS